MFASDMLGRACGERQKNRELGANYEITFSGIIKRFGSLMAMHAF